MNSLKRLFKNINGMSGKILSKLSLSFLLIFAVMATADAQVAIEGETVYTMSGEPIENGVVLINNGKIEAVGPAASVQIPNGYEVYRAAVVTPGLIDARSVVGLAGYYNQDHDQDQLETTDAVQPELRAVDAYNALEYLVSFLQRNGMTTIHTGHGPGAVISGQTMLVKTTGRTVNDSVIDPSAMLAMTLGASVRSNFTTPGTRSKSVAVLRQDLIDARDYAEKRSEGETQNRSLKMEALADLLDGEKTALVYAQRANDIMTALRIQEEFGFEMVLEGAAEAYLIIDEIAESGVPVVIHPTMVRPGGETKNASMETAAKLHEAGVPLAFQSGYEGYVPKTRVARYEAAIAAANGLGMENALYALTVGAAEILGVSDRIGSLEEGKDADVVLFSGDPFEYLTRVEAVIIDGNVVHTDE